MTFTDGNLNAVTLTPATVFVQPTGTASTAIDVTIVGNTNDCTVTLQCAPDPCAARWCDGRDHTGNSQTGLTTSVAPSRSPRRGDHRFLSVHAACHPRGGCQGNGNIDVDGTLVVFGAAAKLAFGQQPTNITGGATITPPVTVQVLDANNNLVTNSNASIQVASAGQSGRRDPERQR